MHVDPLSCGAELTSAEREFTGFLTPEKSYLLPDFDQKTFDDVWQEWPTDLREKEQRMHLPMNSAPHERFRSYGLTPRPEDPTKPLQYVVDSNGKWTMNCFACHSGKVAGRTILGVPNSLFALQTLTEETRNVKLRMGKSLSRMDIGSAVMPLGSSNGTTNAVMFGVALMHYRDADLNLLTDRGMPKMVHHDMDAPPWWHLRRKQQIYADGFAAKGPRGLMQFMLIKQNGPAKFREWESDFRDVLAFIESLQPPRYPFPIDRDLTARGEVAFRRVCADCHGSYGPDAKYPEKLVIPLEDLQTDRVRLDALTSTHRASAYGKSWFAEYGELKNVSEPVGYVAPPLDGIWASAPYLHNGSVPTLWHMLHPSERPAVWRRTEDGYDQTRVGLEVETFSKLPTEPLEGWQRRQYFDTTAFGKSATGHNYPDDAKRKTRSRPCWSI